MTYGTETYIISQYSPQGVLYGCFLIRNGFCALAWVSRGHKDQQ
jgi:hypothetical protein